MTENQEKPKRKNPTKSLNIIYQNRDACEKVLQYVKDKGGRVLASELRQVAMQYSASRAFRDNILNALYVVACLERVGAGSYKAYALTMHGEDLLKSFNKAKKKPGE